MKNNIKILIYIILLLINISCNNKKTKTDYYIIEGSNSVYNIGPKSSMNEKFNIKESYYIGEDWYANLVFVMDSTDMVYIYQTERNDIELKYTPPIVTLSEKDKSENIAKNDTLIHEHVFPNYIGLKPEYLLAIESKNFISFIKLNNDIFQCDTNDRETVSIFCIASNCDTIKNEAFYDLIRYINKKNNFYSKNRYWIRKTTEEEDSVIYRKRNKFKYIPERIKWSSNFIKGNCKPFTNEYNMIERRVVVKSKAKESIKKNSFPIPKFRIE
jgi:hypothetical protein